MKQKHLVIAGAGFGGLKLARCLIHSGYRITMIDRFNHHQFQPLYYQVATAGLEPSSISFPLRSLFHHAANIQVRLAQVLQVQPEENKVITTEGSLDYDCLVLAMGATTNFYGNQKLESLALPMKSTGEAILIRHHILMKFEMADEVQGAEQEALLCFAIAGGGPTGVELAGALAEMKKNVLWKDYPQIDFSKMRIVLVEGSTRTLSAMSEEASYKSMLYLSQMGVEVITGVTVKDYDGNRIYLSDGRQIPAKTLIWAAGIKGQVPGGLKPEVMARGQRLIVNRFNMVEGYQNVFAIGDLAYMKTEKFPNAHPQVASVAISQAVHLAKNLKRLLRDVPMIPYEYKDKGSMATVGKHKAVVDLPWIRFQGLFAWFVWMGIHLVLLMGMKNRLFVFINWAIAYFTNNSSLRLIFNTPLKNEEERMKVRD